jgi:membrane associated rhomboid family serine protease
MSPSVEDLPLIRAQARLIFSLIAIVNWVLGYRLNQIFGLRPGEPWGLIGILCAHFLHGSWKHLRGNTTGFLMSGWFIAMQGIHLFYIVTLFVALVGGLIAWLTGPKGPPGVGASLVLYGYIGFLLIYGITSGSGIALLLAIITAIDNRYNLLGQTVYIISNRAIYSIWRVPWLSSGDQRLDRFLGNGGWYGHMGGFLSGILIAYLLSSLKVLY